LGFRFAPRIRDLGETKLYVPQGVQAYPTLRPLIGGTLKLYVPQGVQAYPTLRPLIGGTLNHGSLAAANRGVAE
ncbi:Tn3 family transposase, partial [Escherichia coli]